MYVIYLKFYLQCIAVNCTVILVNTKFQINAILFLNKMVASVHVLTSFKMYFAVGYIIIECLLYLQYDLIRYIYTL